MMRKACSKEFDGGNAAVKEKSGVMPVLLMALFCLIVGGIDTIMSFSYTALFTFIKMGAKEQIVELLLSFAKTAGHDSIEQMIGIVLIVVILFLRKKHLSKVTYKDFAVMAIFFVANLVASKIATTSANVALNVMNTSHLSAFAVTTLRGTLALFTFPNLINWLCLGVFVLAKSDAKKLSRIFAGAVALISVICSVAGCIFAGKLAGIMYAKFGAAMVAALPAIRIALLLNLFAVCVPVFFWLLYGEGQLKFVLGIIYALVQPALVAVLVIGTSAVGAAIGTEKLGLGLAVTTLGEPVALIICGAALVGILVIKKKREAKKAEKATVQA